VPSSPKRTVPSAATPCRPARSEPSPQRRCRPSAPNSRPWPAICPAGARHPPAQSRRTRQAVLDALPGHSWLYLSGHGVRDPADASLSAFLLHDRPLTFADLAAINLREIDLAYLLACQNSTGDGAQRYDLDLVAVRERSPAVGRDHGAWRAVGEAYRRWVLHGRGDAEPLSTCEPRHGTAGPLPWARRRSPFGRNVHLRCLTVLEHLTTALLKGDAHH
jgi:hypothetical protein